MSVQRVVGSSLVFFMAAACLPQQGIRAPRPLKPEAGPKASIYVNYNGGLLNRSLNTYFRTDQSAYVMVAHLGGDGVIRVLHPSSPFISGYTPGKRTFLTRRVGAPYDGFPSLFSHRMVSYRSQGALHDSYDGRGHGYIFMIASRSPLDFDRLADGRMWAEWEVDEYDRAYDPRYAVRDFADYVSRDGRYTLEFASSFMTSHYTTYADRSFDCSILSSGSFLFSPAWYSWRSGFWGDAGLSRFGSYCDDSRSLYSYRPRYAYTPVILPSQPPGPSQPAPDLNRPGRRGLGNPSPATGRTSTTATLTRMAPSARTGTLAERGLGRELGSRRSIPSGTESPRPRTSTTRTRPDRPTRPSDDRISKPRESGSSTTSTSSGASSRPTTRSAPPTRTESRPAASPRDTRKGRPEAR